LLPSEEISHADRAAGKKGNTAMEALIELDRVAAELLLGKLKGRPTISARVGKEVGRAFGMSPTAGKDLFHAALIIGGVVWLAKK
jgi:hypothetical protein